MRPRWTIAWPLLRKKSKKRTLPNRTRASLCSNRFKGLCEVELVMVVRGGKNTIFALEIGSIERLFATSDQTQAALFA